MKNTFKMVALLPMKFHSERVPGKNFKNLQNKPLFKWILDSLLSVDRIEKVIINTDAVEELKKYGINDDPRIVIRERPEEIRGDFVSMNEVIHDDIENIESANYLMTHTTNPLISSQTINQAIDEYYNSLDNGYDSLFTVNRFQSRFYYENINPVNHDPNDLIRTQDLKPLYEENSCLYLFNKNSFIQNGARIGKNPAIFATPILESVDIDDFESWELAEIFLKFRKENT